MRRFLASFEMGKDGCHPMAREKGIGLGRDSEVLFWQEVSDFKGGIWKKKAPPLRPPSAAFLTPF
jgi:hypothetical protein